MQLRRSPLSLALAASLAVSTAALAIGCGGDAGTTALFQVPRASADAEGFYTLPYPNDIRVDEDGTVALADFPRSIALVDPFIDTIDARQRGFSIHAASYFRFSAAIDASGLPADPVESTAPESAVYLVNIEPTSPEFGQRTPLRFRFEEGRGSVIRQNWLAVLPFPGFPLLDETRYAVVVTDRLRAADGSSLGRSPDFDTVLSSKTPGDPDLARAHQIYAPLREFLGDDADSVISANVFTTQSATSLLADIRRVVYRDVAAPVARSVALGVDAGTHVIYRGLFDGPNFQRGEVPYATAEQGGDIVVENGDPVIQRMEELRFSLSVPPGPVPDGGWPVVYFSHGTGGDYESYNRNGTAAALAAVGIAAISIDQVLHGPRNPGADPELSFFNFNNPLSARDNALQGALDGFQLIRLIEGFDFTDAGEGRSIRFDAERIFFFGHSQGGITGVPFLAHEPKVSGSVLSGAGGILYLSLLHKTEPVDISAIVMSLLLDRTGVDEFHPLLAMMQMWIDRADSVSYGPLLVTRPPNGRAPQHVFHSLGLVDQFTPIPNIEALATSMAVDPVEPILQPVQGLSLRGRSALSVPVSGNRAGTTGVLTQYRAPEGRDGHFVLFDVPEARTQSIEFLRTLATTGEATLVAP